MRTKPLLTCRILALAGICIFLLIACQQSVIQKTVTISIIPEPDNLPEYFHQLLEDENYYCIPGDSIESKQIYRSFRLLQDYSDGKTDKYPAWSVKEALGSIAFCIVQADSEGYCYDPDTINCTACCLNNFLETYLDQALRLCPDMRLLLPQVSDDGKMGIFNFEKFSIPYQVPVYDSPTYLVFRDENGKYHKALWTTGDSFDNMYQIDHNGQRYYLLVNLTGHLGAHFSLVSLNNKGVAECLKPVPDKIARLMWDISVSEFEKKTYPEPEKLIFNPVELTWTECRKSQNGIWTKFPGSKTFKIVFDQEIYIEMD